MREAASAEEALAAIEDTAARSRPARRRHAGVDGWQMLQRMQERHGSIPVIMFSGRSTSDRPPRREQRGAQGFIGKPFDPQQLIERAKQLVPA